MSKKSKADEIKVPTYNQIKKVTAKLGKNIKITQLHGSHKVELVDDDRKSTQSTKDEAKELLTTLDNTKGMDETHEATANMTDFVKKIAGVE